MTQYENIIKKFSHRFHSLKITSEKSPKVKTSHFNIVNATELIISNEKAFHM